MRYTAQLTKQTQRNLDNWKEKFRYIQEFEPIYLNEIYTREQLSRSTYNFHNLKTTGSFSYRKKLKYLYFFFRKGTLIMVREASSRYRGFDKNSFKFHPRLIN